MLQKTRLIPHFYACEMSGSWFWLHLGSYDCAWPEMTLLSFSPAQKRELWGRDWVWLVDFIYRVNTRLEKQRDQNRKCIEFVSIESRVDRELRDCYILQSLYTSIHYYSFIIWTPLRMKWVRAAAILSNISANVKSLEPNGNVGCSNKLCLFFNG